MPSVTKTVMFADEVGSTASTIVRRDAEIRLVRDDHTRITEYVAKLTHGKVMYSEGDAYMIAFDSASDAVQAAVLTHKLVAERNIHYANNTYLRFDLRIGIAQAEVTVKEDGSIYGNATNLAARVSKFAEERQTVITAPLFQQLNVHDVGCESLGKRNLVGIGRRELYNIVKWKAELPQNVNPFVFRDGIRDPSAFHNREKEQASIEEFLFGGQNVSIIGQRRIGKSSLLLQIDRVASKWNNQFRCAFIDLQDPRCYTPKGFFELLKSEWEWQTAPASLSELTERIEYEHRNGFRHVLCLDEFEKILAIQPREFGADLRRTMRACSGIGMSTLTTSRKPLSEIIPDQDDTSVFFNTFARIELEEFTSAEVDSFFQRYRPSVTFELRQRDAIRAVAKGHPFALQVACYYVYNEDSLERALTKAQTEVKDSYPDWESNGNA